MSRSKIDLSFMEFHSRWVLSGSDSRDCFHFDICVYGMGFLLAKM